MTREEQVNCLPNYLIHSNGKVDDIATISLHLQVISDTLAKMCDLLAKIAGKTEQEIEIADAKEKYCINDVDLRYVRLQTKTRNALSRAGFKTIRDIRHLSEKQLLRVRGIGNEAINDIVIMLSDYGIELPKYAKGEKYDG